MTQVWGLCRECRWWETQPGAPHENITMGECLQHELQAFVLRVSGGSGCNRFISSMDQEGKQRIRIMNPMRSNPKVLAESSADGSGQGEKAENPSADAPLENPDGG